ncbi:putative quinol monooxygenase [Modestobacter sp. NPDC049651]|uniref:putative quinol monooxygenase n=1 Tax=unclassified Modestobacter TaxID=2643866 RepID=UPI0033E8A6BE
MFALVVRFELQPGAEEAFDALVAETVPAIHADEPGTLQYVVHTVEDSPGSRLFYEVYRDREAWQAHERYEHTARFLQEIRQHLAEPPRLELLTPTTPTT